MNRFVRWPVVGVFVLLLASACATTADMTVENAGVVEDTATPADQDPAASGDAAQDAATGDAGDAGAGALAGPEDESILPRPADADEQITPERLRDAFETTGGLPALQMLEISTTAFDKTDLHAHQRRIVSQGFGGDGVGVLLEGPSSEVDGERRLLIGGASAGQDDTADAAPVESRSAVFAGQLWTRDSQVGAGWAARPIDSAQVPDEIPTPEALASAFFYLDEIERAVVSEPVFTSVFPDGTRRVSVEFDAGVVGTLALAGLVSIDGFSDPLVELAGVTRPLPGFIEVSADGRVLFVQVDVSAWHLAALSYVTSVDGDKRFVEYEENAVSGLYSLAFAPVDGELVVEQGCIDLAITSCIVAPVEPAGDEPATAATSELTTVLVANATIPFGTLIGEIIDSPTSFVTSQSLPGDLVAPDAIGSIVELQDLGPDVVIAIDVLRGEQLLTSRFVATSDCPLDTPVPDAGDEAQVLVTTSAIPRGISHSELVDSPTVYLSAQLVSIDAICPTALQSVTALSSLPEGLVTVDVPAGVVLDRRHFTPG